MRNEKYLLVLHSNSKNKMATKKTDENEIYFDAKKQKLKVEDLWIGEIYYLPEEKYLPALLYMGRYKIEFNPHEKLKMTGRVGTPTFRIMYQRFSTQSFIGLSKKDIEKLLFERRKWEK